LVAIVFTIAILLAVRWYAIPALCITYALAPAAMYGWRRGFRRNSLPSSV
jgi:hypothetical protein